MSIFYAQAACSAESTENTMGNLLTETNTIAEMIHHPAFAGFGVHLLPRPLGSFGAATFGGKDLPRPTAVIMAYTGHGQYTENDPPTFAVVSSDDTIASAYIMEKRINCLKEAGIPTEFHLYHHADHGFGTGKGTVAENWMDLAVRFWQEQINNSISNRNNN